MNLPLFTIAILSPEFEVWSTFTWGKMWSFLYTNWFNSIQEILVHIASISTCCLATKFCRFKELKYQICKVVNVLTVEELFRSSHVQSMCYMTTSNNCLAAVSFGTCFLRWPVDFITSEKNMSLIQLKTLHAAATTSQLCIYIVAISNILSIEWRCYTFNFIVFSDKTVNFHWILKVKPLTVSIIRTLNW